MSIENENATAKARPWIAVLLAVMAWIILQAVFVPLEGTISLIGIKGEGLIVMLVFYLVIRAVQGVLGAGKAAPSPGSLEAPASENDEDVP